MLHPQLAGSLNWHCRFDAMKLAVTSLSRHICRPASLQRVQDAATTGAASASPVVRAPSQSSVLLLDSSLSGRAPVLSGPSIASSIVHGASAAHPALQRSSSSGSAAGSMNDGISVEALRSKPAVTPARARVGLMKPRKPSGSGSAAGGGRAAHASAVASASGESSGAGVKDAISTAASMPEASLPAAGAGSSSRSSPGALLSAGGARGNAAAAASRSSGGFELTTLPVSSGSSSAAASHLKGSNEETSSAAGGRSAEVAVDAIATAADASAVAASRTTPPAAALAPKAGARKVAAQAASGDGGTRDERVLLLPRELARLAGPRKDAPIGLSGSAFGGAGAACPSAAAPVLPLPALPMPRFRVTRSCLLCGGTRTSGWHSVDGATSWSSATAPSGRDAAVICDDCVESVRESAGGAGKDKQRGSKRARRASAEIHVDNSPD